MAESDKSSSLSTPFSNNTLKDNNHMIHLLDYWRIITKRWKMITVISSLVFAVGVFIILCMPKKYSASTEIEVKREDQETAFTLQRRYIYRDRNWLQNEFKKILSEKVLREVVIKNDLVNYFKQPKPTLLGNMSLKLGMEEHTLANLFKFGSDEKKKKRKPTEEEYITWAINNLKYIISTKEERDSSNIRISVTLVDDRVTPAKIANSLTKAYENYKVKKKLDEISAGISALRSKITELEVKETAAKKTVNEVRKKYQITTFSDEPIRQTNFAEIERIKGHLAQAKVEYKIQEKTLKQLEKMSKVELEEALGIIVEDSQDYLELKNLLNESILDFELLQMDLGINHPKVKRAQTRMKQLRKQMDDRLEGVKKGFQLKTSKAKTKVDGYQTELDQMINQFAGINAAQFQEYNDALKKYSSISEEINSLRKKVNLETIQMDLPRSGVEVTSTAQISKRPSSPRMLRSLAICVILAGIAGVGLAFFREYMDTTIRTVDEVETHLRSQVLSVVSNKVGLISSNPAQTNNDELYRILHTNLSFVHNDKSKNVISILSTGASEGKSTTTANLGYVIARSGRKVLVIDADVRRPVQHAFIGAENTVGLYDVLQGNTTVEEAVHKTSLENLDYLFAGSLQHQYIGLLNPHTFEEIINKVRDQYDLILIDSPPILGVNDAAILASIADSTVLVVKYQGYPRRMIQRAVNTLNSTAGNLAGIVLNNVNTKADNYYTHYYYSEQY